MHPLLDVRPWPRALLQYPLLILTALLLGAALSFAYSYAPLHRAKDWEISYLEERLQSRTEQVETLEEQLRKAEGTLEGQPSTDEVKALRAQLDEANSLGGSLQKQIKDLEYKLTKITRSRDSWKKKHAASVAQAETRKAAPAPKPEPIAEASPDKVAPSPDEAATAPAAPAANTPDLNALDAPTP